VTRKSLVKRRDERLDASGLNVASEWRHPPNMTDKGIAKRLGRVVEGRSGCCRVLATRLIEGAVFNPV